MSIETEGFASDTSPRTAGRLVGVLWSVLLLGGLVSYADRTLTGPVISWMIQNKAGFIGEAAHPATLGGLVGSMFFAGYMLTQYPGGRLGDRFDDPDRYDIKRNVSGHVGFGMGIHQCVGQHVARLEGEIVLAALARKVDRWQITGEPKRRLNNTLRVGQPPGDRQLGREFIRPPEIRGNLWRRLVNSERGAMTDISTSQAQHVVNEAMRKAVEIDTLMNIAVVDAGGNLKAFARMDGAWLGGIDISIRKARTARYFDMNTGDLGALSQPGGSLYNIEVSNGGLITFPGGIPLRDGNGEIIGGIGVSGSIVENDHTVAEAGAKSLS